ncbi:hypothetical protein AVDCRST_MAG81-504 [uncultured Synechococcales cyanobacterium]|uniref:DUF4340 domain-containing protein n=1 Tax=uncultured Synechococcales cyanobacterium TaxID=1936017 RepID=A0A6J4UQ27_9CYAN|nr:hypothetical protein AVDCRST_MAG81-504 [uncultured Synechococcales cyanobacterium]
MKLQASSLILIVIALGLGGTAYLLERHPSSQSEISGEPIFTFEEDQVQALTIKTRQQTLAFVRSERPRQPQQQSKWLMTTPLKAPASEASVAYLLNLLVSARSDRQLNVSVSQRSEFGLDRPLATIIVKLKNQETHQLVLGKPDFNHSSLYAQAISPAEGSPPPQIPKNIQVLLVPTTFENAVNRPLPEWKWGNSDQPVPVDPD